MNLNDHWQAFYDNVRVALDEAGYEDVPLAAIHSQDSQTAGTSLEPPYVVYTEETERPLGTMGGGPQKVLASGWQVTVRTRDLQDLLDIGSAIMDQWERENVEQTADGYVTTAMTIIGAQTLWEADSKLNAMHMRVQWERSK